MTPAPAVFSPNIALAEYACQHCNALPPDFFPAEPAECFRELFAAFEKIRTAWGKPIPITSGYRCEKHNAEVAGAFLSPHIFGVAIDMGCRDADEVRQLKNLAKVSWPGLRIGWRSYLAENKFLVHIDTAYTIFPRPTPQYIRGAQW